MEIVFSVGFGLTKAGNLQAQRVQDIHELEAVIHRYSLPITTLVTDPPIKTREDFFDQPKEIRRQIKYAANYLTAGRTLNGHRTMGDMDVCGIAIMDLDSGSLSAAEIEESFFQWNNVAFETASSKSGDRRWRVVLPLAEPVTVEQYRTLALEYMKTLPCYKDCDEAQLKPTQPGILPILFERNPPAMMTNAEGTYLNLLNYLPHGAIPMTPEQQDDERQRAKLQHYSRPVDNLDDTRITEVLDQLDPEPEAEWIAVGRALHHQFNGEQTGLDFWDAWSRGCPSKYSRQVCIQKWDRFKNVPESSKPTTWRTLEAMVQKRHARTREEHWRDEIAATDSVGVLKDVVVEGISSDAQLTKDMRHALGTVLRARAKELDDPDDWTVARWRAEIRPDYLKPVPDMPKDPPLHIPVGELLPTGGVDSPKGLNWKAEWCYLANSERYFNVRTGERYSKNSLRAVLNRHLYTPEGRLSMQADVYMNDVLKIEYVYDSQYAPREKLIFQRDGQTWVNEWHERSLPGGWSYFEESLTSKPNLNRRQRRAVLKFLRHLFLLLTPEDARWFLIWLAWCVQNEGRKAQWTPMICSVQGAGKTVVGNILRAVFGHPNSTVVTNELIMSDSGFNPWAAGNTFCVVEELKAFGARSNSFAASNKLKAYLTNDTLTINDKNEKLRTVRNTQNYLVFTNFVHPISVESAAERRWLALRSPIRTKEQVAAMAARENGRYFAQLFDLYQDEELVLGIRRWLYHFDLTDPKTGEKREPMGKAPETEWWRDLAEISSAGTSYDAVAGLLEMEWPGNFAEDEGWFSIQHMREHIRHHGYDGVHDETRVLGSGRALQTKLTEDGWAKLPLTDSGTGTNRHRLKVDGQLTSIWCNAKARPWLDMVYKNSVTEIVARRKIREHIQRKLKTANQQEAQGNSILPFQDKKKKKDGDEGDEKE